MREEEGENEEREKQTDALFKAPSSVCVCGFCELPSSQFSNFPCPLVTKDLGLSGDSCLKQNPLPIRAEHRKLNQFPIPFLLYRSLLFLLITKHEGRFKEGESARKQREPELTE